MKNLAIRYKPLLMKMRNIVLVKKIRVQSKRVVHSQEFYILIGSGGAMGLAEAYMLGYWSSEDVVNLLRIVIKNRNVLLSLNKGFSKLFNPINKIIHWTSKIQ